MFIIDEISPTNSLVTVPCRMCRNEFSFTVNTIGINKWVRGELIQLALPELSKTNRELLISNTCDDCFKRLFPPESE